MTKKVLKKILLITIALIVLYIPKCFAAGGSISTSATNVKPGETVELYIDLTTASIGYDIQISVSDDELISSSEVTSKIGSGDAGRIYLVQLSGASDRTTYQSGTRIAKIKYTIAETATPGSTITFNVTGDVAGETSSEKNAMKESVTINIISASDTDTGEDEEPGEVNPPQGDENEQEPGEVNPPQGDENEQEPGQENPPQGDENEQKPGEVNPPQGDENEQEPGAVNPSQEQKEDNKNDDTVAKQNIPKAGIKGYAILMVIVIIAIAYNSFKCNKNKDIK